jgi:hypothetical protein
MLAPDGNQTNEYTLRHMTRAEEAARRAELAANAQRGESAKAQLLVDQFLVDAAAAGIAPEPLQATLFDGATVRTDKTGWYVRRNKSLAVGSDGSFYVLTVPGGWKERLRGVRLRPSPPPLEIGKGGRDGESGPLADFLRWTLERRGRTE